MSTKDDIKARVKRVWQELHKYGIYTEEQLEEALRNQEPLDISCMAGEINKAPTEGGEVERNDRT